MRHFDIYGQAWPRRIPSNGSAFLPTPREEQTPGESSSSRRVTQKALPVLDRKLAAAASSPKTAGQKERAESRPSKRQKTDVVPVTMSESTKEYLNKGLPKAQSTSPVVPVKRKRGRPRLSDIARRARAEEPSPFKDQPRNTNGRFDKKSQPPSSEAPTSQSPEKSSPGRSRAERALERERQKAMKKGKEEEEEDGEADVSLYRSRKRHSDVEMSELDFRGAKRVRSNNDILPLQKIYPHPPNLRNGNLCNKPNPLSFAIRAWVPLLMTDDDSATEDDKGPVTPPETSLSPPIVTVHIGDGDSADDSVVVSGSIPTLLNPSPFNFAKRKWSSFGTSTAASLSPVGSSTTLQPVRRSSFYQQRPQSPAKEETIGHDAVSEEVCIAVDAFRSVFIIDFVV